MPVFKRSIRYTPVKAADIMSSPPVTTREDTVIEEVARLMWDKGVGSILIVGSDNKLVGILTERDMLYASSHLLIGKTFRQSLLCQKTLSQPLLTRSWPLWLKR